MKEHRWLIVLTVVIVLMIFSIAAVVTIGFDRAEAEAKKQRDDYCRGRFALARTFADSQGILNGQRFVLAQRRRAVRVVSRPTNQTLTEQRA